MKALMFEDELPNVIKRLVIMIWFPCFMVGVVLGLILSPITWVFSGKTVFDFMSKFDPIIIAEKWINHDA